MVYQSIFTSQIPALIDLSDSNYTLGTLFTSDVNGYIFGIRTYVGNLNNGNTTAALYRHTNDAEGVLLGTAQFPIAPLTQNAWNSVLFDTPIPIVANQKYLAAYATNQYVATGGFFTSGGLTNGHLTAPQTAFNSRNGKYYVGGLSYPNEEFNGACYFIDVLFDTTLSPETPKDTNRFFFATA